MHLIGTFRAYKPIIRIDMEYSESIKRLHHSYSTFCYANAMNYYYYYFHGKCRLN